MDSHSEKNKLERETQPVNEAQNAGRIALNSEILNPEITTSAYFDYVKSFSRGPQIEGLEPSEIEQVLLDPRTVFLEFQSKLLKEKIKLPFVAPIEYAGWINRNFLARAGYDTGSLMYCILPQELLSDDVSQEEVEQALLSAAGDKDELHVLIDYPDLVKPALLSAEMNLSIDPLMTENETPAATYHYETVCSKSEGVFKKFEPDPSVRQIKPQELDAHLEQIWDIYNLRFKDLVDDHPIQGALKKDQLRQTLESDDTLLEAFFDEDGDIQSFGYLVKNLDLCPWLNQDYFENEAKGRPLVYMPGIASSPKAYISSSTKIMNNMLFDMLKETPEFVLTFECSNKSAMYIPRLVKRAFASSGLVHDAEFKELKHYYRILNIKPLSQD